jgi:hypothetical protein
MTFTHFAQARSRDDGVRFRTAPRPFGGEADIPVVRGPLSSFGTSFALGGAAIPASGVATYRGPVLAAKRLRRAPDISSQLSADG